MRKYFIFGLFVLLVSMSLTLMPLFRAEQNYAQTPELTHSWTKAICNKNNFCQDYEIFCSGNNFIGMSPITGAVVQFPTTWKDTRNNETKNAMC